jgi:hypothetical protein
MILNVQLHLVSSTLLHLVESQGTRENGEKKRMYSVSSRCYARTIYATQLESYIRYHYHDQRYLARANVAQYVHPAYGST